MSRGLAFLTGDRALDYGARLSRLRWRRAVDVAVAAEWVPAGPAESALGEADAWVVVLDATALPIVRKAMLPPQAGRLVVARVATPAQAPLVHTLRELELAPPGPAAAAPGPAPAALLFRAADFPAKDAETVSEYLARLLARESDRDSDPTFLAVAFDEPSERERPELTRRLPAGPLRVLDAGCGAGAGIAAAKGRCPGWTVTGIEWDPELARRARLRCDRVLEADLFRVLPELAREGTRFDAVVFADVLEHLDDPVAALALAKSVAAPGSRLVVSVPNVGHLSIVRDLVAGRFDPIPAGLTDVRHLRWFTRTLLAEFLEEAGWRSVSIEGQVGAPAPDASAFLALAAAWPDGDPESLTTYQWIATALPT